VALLIAEPIFSRALDSAGPRRFERLELIRAWMSE
jgi:hypothetical protein